MSSYVMMAKEMVHAAVDANAEKFYQERRELRRLTIPALDTSLLDPTCVDVQLRDDRQSIGLKMCRREIQIRRPGQER